MSDNKKQLTELTGSKPVSASTEMKASVGLQEMYGRVRITWDIDSRYPIHNAVAQVVEEGNSKYVNHVIGSHQGYFDTDLPYGSGYAGVLWGWSENRGYIHLVGTPWTEQ